MPNDIITKLDDEQVHGLTLNRAMEEMRGPINTNIKLAWGQTRSKAAERRLGHHALGHHA